MNQFEKKVVLMGVLVTSTLSATIDGVRSPINSLWGHMHWSLKDVSQTWWYEAMGVEKEESHWNFHKWASLFTRSASRAFQSKSDCDSDCDSGKNTTKTKKLGVIVFGEESFKAEQSFPGGILNDANLLSNTDPFVAAAYITPDFTYREKGVNWGGKAEYLIDEDRRWAVGFAAHIPFKIVEVIHNNVDTVEEKLEDMFKANVIQADVPDGGEGTQVLNATDLTIRLDLLQSLALDETGPLLLQTTDAPPRLKIGPNEITFASNPPVSSNSAAAFFLYKNNGTVPSVQYRKKFSEMTGVLALNGIGGTDGAVLGAVRGDYQALFADRAAQSNLWLVLREKDNSDTELTTQADAIAKRILYNVQIADLSNRSALEYLRRQGLDLTAHERVVGLGDLDLGLYVRYMSECDWNFKGGVGVLAPTGTKRKDKDGLHVYQFQTGNNRHWELSGCVNGGWMPREWLSLSMGASVHHAFAREEQMPASFTAATIRNLGPLVEGKVSWTYFTAHFNVGLCHPHNSDLGCVIGYQLFAKQKDHVVFENGTSVDFVGRANQVLDASVAERHTSAMLHKFKGELFHRWNFFELFAGVSHAVAGRNAMKETEAHLGCSIYF